MNRLLVNIFLFILPICVFIVGFELLLRNIPNEYTIKRDYLESNAGDIEILFIGSSHIWCSFNPQWFAHTSYNFSFAGQNMMWNLALYEIFMDRLTKLKCIVIDFDSIPLFYDMKKYEKSYFVFNGYGHLMSFFEFYKVRNANTRSLSYFLNYYLKGMPGTQHTQCFENGYLPWFDKMTEAKLVSDTINRRVESFTADLSDIPTLQRIAENTRAMNTLADYARDRDIQLVFVTAPFMSELIDNLREDNMILLRETMDKFLYQYPEVIYLDWMQDPDITTNDFYDIDHLNIFGAEKLSKKLNDFINSLDIEWDCECERAY